MDVSNATGIPFTVEMISIGEGDSIFSYPVGNVLAPYATPIKVELPIIVTADLLDSYNAYSLMLRIAGSVSYIDAFEKEKTQRFSVLCTCGPGNHARFSALQISDPTPSKEK
jgi:hypothetical protein